MFWTYFIGVILALACWAALDFFLFGTFFPERKHRFRSKEYQRKDLRYRVLLAVALIIGIGLVFWLSFALKPSDNQRETYVNNTLGFSFEYPADWTLEETTDSTDGTLVRLWSPEILLKKQQRTIPPGYDTSLIVSHWPDINDDYAKGGSWVGEREYLSLEDYFTDSMALKRKIGELQIDNHPAYEVLIGGAGVSYGVMLEKQGIYELAFTSASNRDELNDDQRQILESFEIVDTKNYSL